MFDIYLTFNVLSDVIALIILVYIISKLAFTDQKIVMSRIARHYEIMRRDKIFRKSLFILGFSLLFSLLSTLFTLTFFNRVVINGLQFLSGMFRIIFFFFLLNAIRKNI